MIDCPELIALALMGSHLSLQIINLTQVFMRSHLLEKDRIFKPYFAEQKKMNSRDEVDAPLWESFSRLHGRSRDGHFVDENPIGAIVPSGVLDRGGCLVSTAERVAFSPHFAIDWVAEGLVLHEKEYWKTLRPSCVHAIRQLFEGQGNVAALIHFESCRDPLTTQVPELRVNDWETSWDLPRVTRAKGNYRFYSSNPAAREISLPHRSLQFLDGQGTTETRLVHLARTRSLATPQGFISGLFDTWCAADPFNDRAHVAEGWIPAGFPLRVENQINTGMLMDFLCLHLSGVADALTLELHPHTAQIVSVRRARVPMELLLRCHQRYHDCIRQALGENPLQFASFPNEIERLQWLMSNPSSVRFKLMTSLRVLLHYVEERSLRRAAEKANVGNHSNARNRLDNLAEALGVSLINSHVSSSDQRNYSEPTPVAKELAMWARTRVPFLIQ